MCGQDEAVAGVGLHEVVDGSGHRRRRSDEGLTSGDFDDQVTGRQLLRRC
jgi:hypothetical protein